MSNDSLLNSIKNMGPQDAQDFITDEMYEAFLPTLAPLLASNPPPGHPHRGYELAKEIFRWKSSIANEIHMRRV